MKVCKKGWENRTAGKMLTVHFTYVKKELGIVEYSCNSSPGTKKTCGWVCGTC